MIKGSDSDGHGSLRLELRLSTCAAVYGDMLATLIEPLKIAYVVFEIENGFTLASKPHVRSADNRSRERSRTVCSSSWYALNCSSQISRPLSKKLEDLLRRCRILGRNEMHFVLASH